MDMEALMKKVEDMQKVIDTLQAEKARARPNPPPVAPVVQDPAGLGQHVDDPFGDDYPEDHGPARPAVQPRVMGQAPLPKPVGDPADVALRAKLEKIEKYLMKSKGGEDFMLDVDGLCLFPDVRLPEKFKMPSMDKFDGSGDPRYHVRMYANALRPLGLDKDQMAQMFQNSLTGRALGWFLKLDSAKSKTWDDIVKEFVDQYSYNIQPEITTRELEATRQKEKETFPEFLIRWRALAAMMTNRPVEKDQVRIVVRNLQPQYFKHLFTQPLANFEQLYDAGMQIEEAIHLGLVDKVESSQGNRRNPMSATDHGGSKAANVNVVGLHPNQPAQPKVQGRTFTPLGMTLSAALDKFVKEGRLQPLEPTPPPNPLPHRYNPNQYCAFHQSHGHLTDKCSRLRHEIQNLIDDKVIAPPTP